MKFMWRADGKGEAYVSHMDQPGKWAESLRLENFWFQKGVVHTLGLEVVLNTPGERDGTIQGWLDGVLVVDETNMRFRSIPDLKIEGINFGSFFGGNTDSWAPNAFFVLDSELPADYRPRPLDEMTDWDKFVAPPGSADRVWVRV